jgi:hypothetical protein
MSALGLDPLNIFSSLQRLIRDVSDTWASDAVRVAPGTAISCSAPSIVIPIWLILRLVRRPRAVS